MKKQIFASIVALSVSVGSYAQGEMEVYKFSRNDLTGTARSVSMGGAFGALGGDISGIAINPAGIGIYRSSEVVTTVNFQNNKSQTTSNVGKFDKDKFKFTFDNLAFVGVFPINSDIAPTVNFGFSYNRIKSFDRKYQSYQQNTKSSLTDYMAYRSNLNDAPGNNLLLGKDRDPWRDNDRLSVLGYNSALINDISGRKFQSSLPKIQTDNSLYVKEKGSISSYDFNVGTMFADVISFGLSLSVTDIDYHLYSAYSEDFDNFKGGYDLYNWVKTEGTGWQLKAGLLFKPIDELRIGVSYHSPTWYDMTDYSAANIDDNLTGLMNVPGNQIRKDYKKGVTETPEFEFDYELRTPDKWTFSLAGVIGQTFILSADYELTNYKNMKLYDRDGNPLANQEWDPNNFVKNDFKMASTVRLGAEFCITPQFAARVGYAWMQSPLQKEFKNNDNEVVVVGTTPNYILDGDINHITYGLGYRFSKNFYADLAFVMKSQKSDLYMFPKIYINDEVDIQPEKVKLKDNTFQGLLTLGVRF